MPQSQSRPLQAQALPPSAGVASNPALSALRAEIDAIDERILALVKERQALSARAAASKAPSDLLKIRPDREDEVIARLQEMADPASAGLVERLWRELLSDGLGRQSPFALALWSGAADETAVLEAARKRFGRGPGLRTFSAAQAVLDRAAQSCDVAILGLEGDWWVELPERWPQLSAFAVLCREDGAPCALALARLEPGALSDAPAITVRQGDGNGAAGAILASSHGSHLVVEPSPADPAGRAVGAACGWTSTLSSREARA